MKSKIFVILKKEMRELFRDKKSLAMMLIIPFLIPVLVLGMSALFEFQMKEDEENKQLYFAYELTEMEKEIAEALELKVIIQSEEELTENLKQEKIDFYIGKDKNKNPNSFVINKGDITTNTALATLFIEHYKQQLQSNYLIENNLNPNLVLNIVTIEENVVDEKATEENYFANYIKNYAFLFIMMAIVVSATYPATDTTAGERERGTLETLLTFPVKSRDIIIGKYLSITLSSIITGIISLLLATVSLGISQQLFSLYKGLHMIYSMESIFYGIVVIIVYSFFISGLCIAIASKSKTFKEAQSALTPLNFISFFPGMIAFMIGTKSSLLLSCVPFLNFTMLFTDITNGTIHFGNILVMILSSVFYISLVLVFIIKQYKSERVLFVK